MSQGLALDGSFVTSPEVAARNVCTRTNDELRMSEIDDSMSGTTAILALVRGTQLIVANVGDSRAVLAERNGHELIAKDLSWDQTPMRPDECARVKSAGARVLSLEQLHGTKDSRVQEWSSKVRLRLCDANFCQCALHMSWYWCNSILQLESSVPGYCRVKAC